MKKIAIVTALLAVGALTAYMMMNHGHKSMRVHSANPVEAEFSAWKVKYGKTYGGVEHSTRFYNFVENKNKIDEINSVPRKFKVGLNQFADLTSAEFSSLYLGAKKNLSLLPEAEVSLEGVPSSLDWRAKGAVTPVKNQGQCGSCWSFSVTGSLEGAHFVKTGKLLSFSEQQLVDCSGSAGNQGCDGGDMYPTLVYTAKTGIELESDYEYTATDGDCQYDAKKVQYKNKGAQKANSDSALQKALNVGPVSVSVEADQSVFQYYTSGVLDSEDCGTQLDHGVLAVGYGVDQDGTKYWIVKNSWGSSWGDNGFLKIARTSGNGICGINMDNSYPTN